MIDMDDLNSVEEWVDYINQIPMLEMINHARILGSVKFQEELEEECYENEEIMTILQTLAKRFLDLEMRVPDTMDNALVSFREIASQLV
jgi:hypothetical protein